MALYFLLLSMERICVLISLFPVYITPVISGVVRNPYYGLSRHQSSTDSSSTSPLEVDLGYATYRGVHDQTVQLNTWLGIRFAEAPTGNLRWQRPEPPQPSSDKSVIDASAFGNICPQSPDNVPGNGAFKSASNVSEDCLFLNIYAPLNATNLPVFVYIHGGGYGSGNGQENISFLLDHSRSDFIGVSIQYRLGAFGFLASDEVKRFGTPNAGLYDQFLTLQWVQHYISLFGGNPDAVTIAGESAGGGSVMLQSMAFGGSLDMSLFDGIIAASPYLPMQYRYSDFPPSQMYYAFAAAAGCFDGISSLATASIFKCLVGKDTKTLQNASYTVGVTAKYGQWAFLPVTDDIFIQHRPSLQLMRKQINGRQLLVGNNADEGTIFTPQNITTEDNFVEFVRSLFPLFTESDINKTLSYYPAPVHQNTVMFSTNGTDGSATAVNESTFATAQQQRANNLYGEVTFVCPSYWMAEAFSGQGRSSYKYQFSVIPALHTSDTNAYFGPAVDTMSPTFQTAVSSIFNSFIVNGTPSSSLVTDEEIPSNVSRILRSWPAFTVAQPIQINLNQTGGVETVITENSIGGASGVDVKITEYVDPGLTPNFELVDAYTWEGGRGQRCDFWRMMAPQVPA